MDVDAIIAQMEWARARGLTEFAVNHAGTALHIRRDGSSPVAGDDVPAPVVNAPAPDAQGPQTIDAPLAGICHLSGEAGGAAFVAVGDAVRAGQTICVIEAMKVMTSVPAPISGWVAAILVQDGASVDAQTPLFEVRT